ncbi:MAG: LysR family transcriptional regulator [Fusobacterium gastrosuis]|uniref:LysR family transcriptional regulator n=1 Tax=Fusobacterium gastrosuis TaxID=1755100 RepID=UPI002A8AFE6B|nr:LysR family transcriptional regulator [Fusobacterium gastrosuis]
MLKQNQKIFLLVAENLSFTKAAEKAFVTQQCVSNHIQRLEEEYNVKLFSKIPHLHLTEAGKILYSAIKNMEIISSDAFENIKEIAEGKKGNFAMGISTSRAKIILPSVLKKYHQLFPDMKISFYVNDTRILEKKLLDGEIDIFLGVNTSQNKNFRYTHLVNDYMHLIISEALFQKFFSEIDFQTFLNGVDLKFFADIPFSLYYETGALNLIIKQHLLYEGITLHQTPYYISDCDTQIQLCQLGITASIVPKMLSYSIYEYNNINGNKDKILIFPIKNFNYPLRIDLVDNINLKQPLYISIFYQLMKEEIENLMK